MLLSRLGFEKGDLMEHEEMLDGDNPVWNSVDKPSFGSFVDTLATGMQGRTLCVGEYRFAAKLYG